MATIYHVDSEADPGGDGSEGSPWQPIAPNVNIPAQRELRRVVNPNPEEWRDRFPDGDLDAVELAVEEVVGDKVRI